MRLGMVAAGAAAVMMLAGCGSEGPEPSIVAESESSAPPGAAASGADLARLLPDVEADAVVTFGDVEGLASANGVAVPQHGDVAGLVEWAQAPGGTGVPVLLPGNLAEPRLGSHDGVAEELGVSLWGAQRYAGVDAAPTHVTLLDGDGLGDAMTEAMGDPVEGVWAVGGEEVRTDLSQRTDARPTGEALRLALTDSEHAIIASTESLARAGAAESSSISGGEVGEVGAVLDQLSADDVVSGVIAQVDPGSPGAPGANGVGFGSDDEGVFARLVLAYGDAAGAEAAVPGVEEALASGTTGTGRPWSDLLAVEAVTASGGTVVIEARFTLDQSPQNVATLIMQGPAELRGLPGR